MDGLPATVFSGPVKTKILVALAGGVPVFAGDLCEAVFGSREPRRRDSLRNLVQQMRPRLAAHGYEIRGRKHLRMNAYQLVNTLLEG